MPRIALHTWALSKAYGDIDAAARIDLRVASGEIHGLLGLNGAGKTTLLRMLLGLVTPSDGGIRLLGRAAGTTPGPARGGVAGLVDSPRFYSYLTGRQNLRLLARLDGASADVTGALEQAGLGDAADARVASYSAGMVQRLGMASALLRAPQLLLLDEPTSALDPAGARDVRVELRRLAEAGTAVLFSSHDLREVEELCSAVTILHRGRVVFTGRVEELRKQMPGEIHALATSDDPRALAVAKDVAVSVAMSGEALEVNADPAALDRYVIALGREGIAVRALARRDLSLETLFLRLTADASERELAPTVTSEPPEEAAVTHPGGWRAVVSVEIAKLRARALARATLGVCLAGPFLFVGALKLQSSLPEDTLFGRHAKASGFAIPLVVLGFAGTWLLPLLGSVVGGELFASEDRAGTWSTLLTRSRTRSEIFVGKTLTAIGFTCIATLGLAISSMAAGMLLIGTQPLLGLSGTLFAAPDALRLVAMAWASVLLPAFAFTGAAVLISVGTRSSAAGIGLPVLAGLVMQLLSLISGPEFLRRSLLTTSFGAWHGLFTEPGYHRPLLEGIALSGAYLITAVAAAHVIFCRREMGS